LGSFLDISNILIEFKLYNKNKDKAGSDEFGMIEKKKYDVPSDLLKNEIRKLENQQFQNSDNPNIILALNESLFNPYYLDYDFVKKFDFDLFNNKSIKSSGALLVRPFGGNTVISEYEIITGIAVTIFGGANYYPHLNMTKYTNSNLLAELKKRGYYNIIIYSVSKNTLNAENSYLKLGADKVLDISDYNFNPVDWRYISEKFLGFIIQNEIKNAPKDKPVFVFVLTMKNHGPHNNEEIDSIGCKSQMKSSTCSQLNDYIKRLKLIDYDWKIANEEILNSDKKTIMIHFGDHQPSFDGEIVELNFKYPDGKKSNYRTFYNIRANYEIPEFNLPLLDITYMPSIILDMVGGTDNEFYKASSFMREKCNGLFYDCDKKHHDFIESYKSLMSDQLSEPLP
jgi:phosphoglycerol transferase MdoB-like AlkP superfamily enzyme